MIWYRLKGKIQGWIQNGIRQVLPAGPRGAILLYHRVTNLRRDPQLLAVTPDHFEEHLKVLKDKYRPVRLSELQQSLSVRDGSYPVAVTFDDGYFDNLAEAKPLLEKYQVPATIFVTSGQIGSRKEFWWDELDRLLLGEFELPDELSVHIDGKERKWEDLARRSEGMSDRWSVLDQGDPSGAHRMYRELCPLVRNLSSDERERVLDQLRVQMNVGEEGRESHRSVTECELRKLEGGMVEIGAHTVTHTRLAMQSLCDQEKELRSGKESLERILGRRVTSFAYPYGTTEDYTSETTKIAAREFYLSCVNIPGLIRTNSPHEALPRYLVRDWSGAELSNRLNGWLHG